MLYIASPYSHKDPNVMEQRYLMVRAFSALGLKKGFMVYSPIVHCHELAKAEDLPKDFEFWMTYNKHMIGRSSALVVCCIPGWQESLGVTEEITFAGDLKIPVTLVKELISLQAAESFWDTVE